MTLTKLLDLSFIYKIGKLTQIVFKESRSSLEVSRENIGGKGVLIHTYTCAHTYLLIVINNGGVYQIFSLGNTSWAHGGIVLLGTFVIG